ncbi:MAG: zf-HC2 domain-containing protein [Sneathiella sp.]
MNGSKITVRRRIKSMMFKIPLMISCDEFEDFIADYLTGDLSKKRAFIFETHLKVCRECRQYLRAMKASMIVTTAVVIEEASVDLQEVPEDLIAAIIAANNG